VDFGCVSLVSHYHNDILCKNVFVKVIPKILLVPFFSGHGVEHVLTTVCLHINWKVLVACDSNFIVKIVSTIFPWRFI